MAQDNVRCRDIVNTVMKFGSIESWEYFDLRENFHQIFHLVKRPGHEADHSPLSSAEVKNAWSHTSTPHYAFMAWCLLKHKDNFTFTLANYGVHTRF
jgi:hypothetical protein